MPIHHPKTDVEEKNRVLTTATLQAAEILGLSQKELGEILGESESSISRTLKSRRVIEADSKAGELATLLLLAFRSLDSIVGGSQEAARIWLNSKNDYLGDIPRNLIVKTRGLTDVCRYLDAMRGKSNLLSASIDAFRVVEDQSRSSTMKLVNTAADHGLLEEMLDASKPKFPFPPYNLSLHYLLYTPFRYPPLNYGSRFGSIYETSLWYGSRSVETAFAEKAYYRFLFRLHAGGLGKAIIENRYTAYSVSLQTNSAIDLSSPVFNDYRDLLVRKDSYSYSQPFGTAARADGAILIKFPSARDPLVGENVAVLHPSAFAHAKPNSQHLWESTETNDHIVFRSLTDPSLMVEFAYNDFLVGGKFPLIA